jgi:uncharacterized membrane protein
MNEIDTYDESQVAELPAKRGFRQRGMEMTRLETFTDAAFAFAVTLLVVGGGDSVPSNSEELRAALNQVPAFAASFANIMLFWYAHHKWSRRYGLEDTKSVLISLTLIFVVLIYVYPLKATYSGALEFFSNGYLESYFELSSFEDLRSLFFVFGTGYAALSATIVLLYRHALSVGDRLSLNVLERFDSTTEYSFWTINVLVALISVVLSLTLPDRFVVISGMFYSVFAFTLPWYRLRRGRLRAVLAVSESGEIVG